MFKDACTSWVDQQIESDRISFNPKDKPKAEEKRLTLDRVTHN